jgi:sarcosine oxidase subunit delta
MILVPCPYCGARDAAEFNWKGEVRRRPDPSTATSAEWRRYLYMRRNVAGWSVEKWLHRDGCGRYFTLERNTVTNQFQATSIEVGAGEKSSVRPSEEVPDDGVARPHGGK